MEAEARSILLLLDRPPVPLSTLPSDPWKCPNCGLPVVNAKSPYCGECCKSQAAFIRQYRAGRDTGFDEERQVAMGQSLWQILGGGYPLRRSMVPERVIQKVIARDGGLCGVCQGPATTIDHIRTACNRPINLRAVCETCCRDRPFLDPVVMRRHEFRVLLDQIATRVQSPEPLRVCDDQPTWDWRAFVNARKG